MPSIVSLYVYLFEQLLFRLFDSVTVHLHLFREKLVEPDILLHLVVDEPYGLLPFDLHRSLALFPVVEPRFCPPAHPRAVGIDGDDPRYVEALDVDLQLRQRVDYSAGIIRKSKCSTDFKRNDFLKKNEAYPLGALRSLKFAYRKLRISLFVELAV